MSYNPNNPNGQATMANSQPVVIASNQSNVPTTSNGTIFTFSTVNSSTAQLAASATFTGTVESVVSQQSYSVLFFSDQNATITIKQYIDAAGTKLVSSLAFTYTANAQFARSGVLNGNYCNVVVQNTGGSTTTTLQLDTAYGTIPSATQLNNNPSAINEINGTVVDSNSGNKSAGSQRIVIATDDVNASAINTNTTGLNSTVGTSGSAIQTKGLLMQGSDGTNAQNLRAGTSTTNGGTTINALVVRPFSATDGTNVMPTMDAAARKGFQQLTDGTTNVAVIAATTALKTDLSSIAGTATVTAGVAGIQAVGGNIAHSTAATANPLGVGGKVVPTTIATVDATLVAGDASNLGMTTGYQAITKQFGTAELDYAINFSSISTTVTVQQLVPASGTASVRNYISGMVLSGDTLGAAGVGWVLDGALTVSSIAITTGLATTSTAHDLKVGDSIVFTALAAGTGVSTNTVYYVTSVGSTTTFNFATSIGGSNVVPSVAYTGTTMYRILHQFRFQTTAVSSPVNISFQNPLRGNGNVALNFLFPSSLTSGNVYLSLSGYRGF